MEVNRRTGASRSSYPGHSSVTHGRSRSDSHTEVDKRKGKDSKPRWLAQIRDWVSLSEPSTQALKNYKLDTYKRAGVALDDPCANAKLHIPVARLPAEAIKPYGSGPDPEDMVRRRLDDKKPHRDSVLMLGNASRDSRTSGSQDSSRSSLGLHEYKRDF
ncbi:hypothetical protein BX600DRAFT_454766 [Xylariales sp. PMI_506]|nr:hypothetical protein BX600DRAFT_454766 [Xylariales sp. PMI_506]